jgi:AcrR family transcriptional regulator
VGGVEIRERHREEKRELIQQAAARVFARQGLERTSVADVAGEAGFSPGSVYNYFTSKEELLFAATFAEIDQLEARMRPALGAGVPADEALRRMADAYYGFYRERPQGFRLLMAGLHRAGRDKVPASVVERYDLRALDCLTLLHAVVERGTAEGTFEPCDSWETTHAIWGALHGILDVAAAQDRERFVGFEVKGLFDRTVELLIDGIKTGGAG